MIKVIKNIKVYSPKYLGIKDVVIASDKIEGIYDSINIPENFINVEVINGEGKLLFPGFIDNHVHISGAGGEGGFRRRTPEIMLSSLITAGITTVVGCIGIDGVCRNMASLIAKAKSLEEEGITTYCYTGSYEIPVKPLTESIKKDIMLIDKIIGIGEIAISDTRSSQATYEELVKAIAQSRVGGLLSGKSGIVNIHLGDGTSKLGYLFKLADNSEIPLTQILPTHINRNGDLFKSGEDYINKGGYIDLTTSTPVDQLAPGELRASEAFNILVKNKSNIENVTFSSDGNGSLPIFDDKGKIVKIGICTVSSLYEEVVECIKKYGIHIEEALKVITSNVAKVLKLNNKGSIEVGKDADLVLVDEKTLKIKDVIALGKVMLKDGEVIVKGTFE